MFIDADHISPGKIFTRIVSLVPSQTELLHALGLEKEVVAITKFCVHPREWHRNKTRVGGTKSIKTASITPLNPDLIIANKEENVREQVEELAMKYDVFVTDVNDLAAAISMIHNIGRLAGKTEKAVQIADAIEERFQRLQEVVSSKEKIKSAYLIWKDPFMAAGGDTFINDMMQYCGLTNIFSSRRRYPIITPGELFHCDLVLLSSEPYPFKEIHVNELGLQVHRARILLVDGEMFSWYGSRLLKAAGYLESLLFKLKDYQ